MVTSELTRTVPNCPRCGGKLWENEGAYWCSQCKDVTAAVQRQQAGNQSATRAMGAPNIGAAGPLPAEIPRWSWAAFGFNWIWALARGLWVWGIGIFLAYAVAFIIFWVPIVGPPISGLLSLTGLVLQFVLGFMGNTLDWQHGDYSNAYAFRKSHRRWFIAMKIILWLFIVDGMLLFIAIIYRLFSTLGG